MLVPVQRKELGAAADALRAEHRERELRRTQGLAAERAARAAAEAALAEVAGTRGPAARTRGQPSLVESAAKAQGAAPAAKAIAKRTRKAVAEPQRHDSQPVKWSLKSAKEALALNEGQHSPMLAAGFLMRILNTSDLDVKPLRFDTLPKIEMFAALCSSHTKRLVPMKHGVGNRGAIQDFGFTFL